MTHSAPTDAGIDLDALRAGDRVAFVRLVETYADPLYNLALKLTGHPQDAEDVLQETLVSAYRSIGGFQGRSQIGTWLYRIATNVALMHQRRRQPDSVSIDEPLALGDGEMVPRQLFDWCCLPEPDLMSAEARQMMEQAIQALPETLKTVFVLRDIEGLSTEETGEVLGLSESAVKSRLHRARLFLRERLSEYFAEWAGGNHD